MTKSVAFSLWRADAPLILASRSFGRRQALEQAGIPFEAIPADVDERVIEEGLEGADADRIALTLARVKALAISARAPGRLVLGADQTASCGERIFGKPRDMDEAKELLQFLSGRRHRLHSAIVLARDNMALFETIAHADLMMRNFSDAFLAAYLSAMGETALSSAGAYQIEGLGAHLFSNIEGDHWTIMGLPLIAALDALREQGALLS